MKRGKKKYRKLNRATKMLNFGASKPRIWGGGARPPQSAPGTFLRIVRSVEFICHRQEALRHTRLRLHVCV